MSITSSQVVKEHKTAHDPLVQPASKKDNSMKSTPAVEPFIPASKHLPELTLKAFILGIILAIVLAGSNAYLGLKMGQTIAASIPAAVISMAVLRLFRQSNILENNIVQTIASAGEVVAAAMVFTIPALIVLGYWTSFDYWQITAIATIGGVLGVLFSVPLRRALIIEEGLKYPEGVAAAEVLKAGETNAQNSETKGAGLLVAGGLGAALMKFMGTGLHVLNESISGWFRIGNSVFGFTSGLSLSMLGAGYIVGLGVCINLLIGTILAWLVIAPLYGYFVGGPEAFGLPVDASAEDFAMTIRSLKLRYIGVGTMVFGGLWSVVSLYNPIKSAVASSFTALKHARHGLIAETLRTEKDIPMTWVVGGILLTSIPMTYLFHHVMATANLPISGTLYAITLLFLTVSSLFIGFICAAIGGYMAGIVGSSANPMSGITIGALLIVSLLLILILGQEMTFGVISPELTSLAAVVIIIGGVVASSAALSCDNLQDLKSGQLVGATPWKQQVTLIAGVVAGAMVIAPILELLFQAYGMAGVFPREGMNQTMSLSAPQANLMASVVQGVFEHKMDWVLVIMGLGIGLAILLVDRLILARNNSSYRLSIMAVALGLYLPMDVTLPLMIGGIISYFAQRSLNKQIKNDTPEMQKHVRTVSERRGLLFGAGLIAGDALIGIFLAIPFATYQDTNILAIVGDSFSQTATILGTIGFAGFAYYFHILGSRVQRN